MLKATNDGLSKSWKPSKIWDPFYKGGKIQTSKDGQRYIVEFDGNIKVVSVNDPSDVFSLWSGDEEHEAVTCFALNPANNNEIAVATAKGALALYDLQSRSCIRTMRAHRMPILCMDYDPSGTLVATGSADRTVRVWDMTKGFCTHSFANHTDIVKTVMFHTDPHRLELFSTSDDNSIAMYDLRDSQCVAQFREHFALPTQCALSEDGYVLVSCGRDKVLNFYELRTRKHLKTIPIMDELDSLAVLNMTQSRLILQHIDNTQLNKKQHSTQQVVIASGAHGLLHVYCFALTGKDSNAFVVNSVIKIALSPLLVKSLQHSNNSNNNQLLSEEMQALKGITKLLLSVDNNKITAITADFNFATYSSDQIASAIQKSQQQQYQYQQQSDELMLFVRPEHVIVSNHGDILDIIRLPLNNNNTDTSNNTNKDALIPFRLAIVSNSLQLRIVDEHMNTTILEAHTDIILAADVSPCGKWMATSSKDRTVRIWNIHTGECVAVCEGHTDPVGAVTLAHSMSTYASRKVFAVSGSGDKILKRFSLPVHSWESTTSFSTNTSTTLTSSHSVRAHDKDINSVMLSPDDSLLLSASQDKTIRVWQSSDLSPVATLRGHKRGVWRAIFSPIDKMIVSCSADRTIKLWSAVDFALVKTLEGSTSAVLNARLIRGGAQLICGSAEGLVRLWTLRTGECEEVMDVHEDRVWAVETLDSKSTNTSSSNGEGSVDEEVQHYFVSAGSDSKIVLWRDVTTEVENDRLAQSEQLLVLEQQLHNYIRNKDFHKALKLTIELNHPSKALFVLSSILEEDKTAANNSTIDNSNNGELFKVDFSHRLDNYVTLLTDKEIMTLLNYVKEWNTNSRNCYVSQLLLQSMFNTIKVHRLMSLQGFNKELCNALHAYTERHYQRVSRLSMGAHLLGSVLTSVSLLPLESIEHDCVNMADAIANNNHMTTVNNSNINNSNNKDDDVVEGDFEEHTKEKQQKHNSNNNKNKQNKKRKADKALK